MDQRQPETAQGVRPRDEAGRPQPRGSAHRLPLDDNERLTVAENHLLALRRFREGRHFSAHEAWEAAWKRSCTPDERAVYKGLAQIAAGYVHWQRGNPRGAATLLRRGAGTVPQTDGGVRDPRIAALVAGSLTLADLLEILDDGGNQGSR